VKLSAIAYGEQILHIDFVMIHTEGIMTLTYIKMHMLAH